MSHEWQERELEKFIINRNKNFLLEATPGAGKTRFSAKCAAWLFKNNLVDFAIIVAPQTAIKGDKDSGFLGEWAKENIQITTVLKEGRDPPREYKGGVITYSQLVNIQPHFDVWARNGLRIFAVFDEVHHASEDNKWGAAAEGLGHSAIRILCLTGTPFRGDERRISFVNYNDKGKAISDGKYLYRDAVAERVCRPVEFMTDDGTAEWILHEEEGDGEAESIQISEAEEDEDARNASRVIFGGQSQWLEQVINRADAELDAYRTWDIDAGGLIICRPGNDQNDDKHLYQVAKLLERITGERPEIITHEDPDATAKISRFRKGTGRWICAVRKISEGVDIKRLRVEVMACRPTTELLFRQLIGRVVRVDDNKRPGNAKVFIAKFPQLQQWSKQIQSEAEDGIREREEQTKQQESERDPLKRMFTSLGSTHEPGGAISDFGDEFSAAEINRAEKYRLENPQLQSTPITTIAFILRKSGPPDPEETVQVPLQIIKTEKRKELVRLSNRIMAKNLPLDATKEMKAKEYKKIWGLIGRHTGAKNIDDLIDNKSVDVLEQAISFAKKLLGDING